MDTEFRLGKMKKFWRGAVVMFAQSCEYSMPCNCTIKNDKSYTYFTTVLKSGLLEVRFKLGIKEN